MKYGLGDGFLLDLRGVDNSATSLLHENLIWPTDIFYKHDFIYLLLMGCFV